MISQDLRCLVCQNQSIDDSNASLARDLRLIVRERLSAGDTDTQVFDYVVARYGNYVLLKPPLQTDTVLLWAAPFIMWGLGAAYSGRRSEGPAGSADGLKVGLPWSRGACVVPAVMWSCREEGLNRGGAGVVLRAPGVWVRGLWPVVWPLLGSRGGWVGVAAEPVLKVGAGWQGWEDVAARSVVVDGAVRQPRPLLVEGEVCEGVVVRGLCGLPPWCRSPL